MPTLLETDKTVKITINSVDRSANYRTGTIHIHTTLGAEVDTCQFELEDTDGTLPAFTGWLAVLIEDEAGTDLFGGVIVNAIPKHQPGGDRLIWAISCVDYSVLMQTKVVDRIYVGQTAAAILDDLFSTYLPEIDATTHVATGGTRTMRFDRVTLFDAVKMLADVDGYLWWVDASKNLHYTAPGSAAAAPFDVGDAENSDYSAVYPYLDGSLTVDYDDREIRNRVIVHGGTYASGQTTETFSGDDTTDVFTVSNRPLRSIIAVLVGGVAQAVGRDWIDNPANFDVLVNYNYGTLTWATPPPTGTDNITVIYTYDISIRVTRNDSASQTAYGRVFEFVHVDRSIGSEAQAEALADAILGAYAGRRTYGSFSVQMPGLSPGQEIEITDDALGWTAEAFIIQSVTLTEPAVGVFELRIAFGDRQPGFTDIARGFGGGAGGATVGGAGTGGGGGQGAYEPPATPGGLEHLSQNLGIIYVGRAEFLEIGTSFTNWDDYNDASGVVVGYDYIDDTGRILVLNSGARQVGIDYQGITLRAMEITDAGELASGDYTKVLQWLDDADNKVFSLSAIEADVSEIALGPIIIAGISVRGNATYEDAYMSISALDADQNAQAVISLSNGGSIGMRADSYIWYGSDGLPEDEFMRLSATGLGIGAGSALAYRLHVIETDAATNTHSVVGAWGHNSTGTPAASFALRHLYQLASSTTINQDAAAFDVIATTATHASFTTAARWLLRNSGAALAEAWRMNGNASLTRKRATGTYDLNLGHINTYVVSAGGVETLLDFGDNSRGGAIRGEHSGGGAVKGYLATRSGSTYTNRVTWDESGRVGIVTTAPQTVQGATFTTPVVNLDNGTARADYIVRGNPANINLINASGAADDKWLQLNMGSGGIARFRSLNDVNDAAIVDNILAMDLSSGQVMIGTNTPVSGMTRGLFIQQGANDDFALALASSDVAHGVTGIAPTDVYMVMLKASATLGGILTYAFAETGLATAMQFVPVVTDTTTTKSTAASGAMVVDARKKSGTGTTSMDANANLFVVRDNANARFLVDAEGDVHYDATTNANAWDTWDDVQLVRALEHTIAPQNIVRNQFDAWLKYNRADVVAAGILSDGGFVNLTQLTRLHSGAIWQMHTQMMELRQEIAALREGLN